MHAKINAVRAIEGIDQESLKVLFNASKVKVNLMIRYQSQILKCHYQTWLRS